MRKIGVSVFALSLLINGCAPKQPNKAVAKPPEVLVVAATTETITDFEEFTGHTEAKNMVEVKARVTGYLKKVHFKDGDTVNEGDLLLEIDPSTYLAEKARADAVVTQAETKFRRMDSDYQRAIVLRQTKAMTPEEFDKIKGDRGEAEAAIAVARANRDKAQLDLDFTRVRVPNLSNDRKADPNSPRTGRVSRRMTDPGNLVKADETMLTTIVTLDPMQVYFDVDERTVLGLRSLIKQKKIKSVREMTFRFGLADDEGKFPYHGQIDFENNRLDTGTGTLQLRGEFKNPMGLAPGLFIRLRLYVGAPRKAVMVPERALGTDQGQKFLYVVKKDTSSKDEPTYKAEYRGGTELELGALRDGWRVIEKGVEAGERVIWSGLQRVRKDGNITPRDQEPPNAKGP